MAMNPETQVNASVVMSKEVYERLKAIALKNKRSVSKQVLYWIEEQIESDEQAREK